MGKITEECLEQEIVKLREELETEKRNKPIVGLTYRISYENPDIEQRTFQGPDNCLVHLEGPQKSVVKLYADMKTHFELL